MATQIFQPNAIVQAQQNSVTVGGTPANGQVYSVVMGLGNKTVSYTAGVSDTNTTVASALQALLAASTIPEFQEVTWAINGAVITGTATTAGVPFTNTSSATGTGTLVTATATANGSPSDWGNATNWSTGSVPVTGDDVYVSGTTPIRYGLSQSGVTLNSLNILGAMTADVGNAAYNGNGYYEYRPTYLAISATTINVGQGIGGGSQRVRLNTGTVATTVNVYGTGQSIDQTLQALCLQGSNASNVLNLYAGSVGVAMEPGQTAQYSEIRVGYTQSQTSDVTLIVGSGCTVGQIDQDGGNATVNVGGTTWNVNAGTALLQGTGAFTTVKIVPDASGVSATFNYKSTGTLSTVIIGPKGKLDTQGDIRPKQINSLTLMAGSSFLDHDTTIKGNAGGALALTLNNCGLEDVDVELGRGLSLTRA